MGVAESVKSAEPLSVDELRALWNTHDVNGTDHADRFQVGALMEDIRLRYGVPDPFSETFVDSIFEEIDKENLGFWTWHDFRQLGGESYFRIKRQLQRTRLREKAMPAHAKAKLEKRRAANTSKFVNPQVGGFGAPTARVLKYNLAEPEITGPEIVVTLHALRVRARVTKQEGLFAGVFGSGQPVLLVRVVRGDPRIGTQGAFNATSMQAALEGPSIAQLEVPADTVPNSDDAQWLSPISLSFVVRAALYVQIIFKVGAPIAELSFSLRQVVIMMEQPSVQEFDLDMVASQPSSGDKAALIAQWGGQRPRLHTFINVFRAGNLPALVNFVVFIEVKSAKDMHTVWKGQTKSLVGPNPIWREVLEIDCFDESGAMLIFATVCDVEGQITNTFNPRFELIHPVLQSELNRQDFPRRRPLRPLKQDPTGAFLTLDFGGSNDFFVWPRSASGLAPKLERTSFNPFVRVTMRSDSIGGVILAESRTETLSNVLGDPDWEKPCILNTVLEDQCFLHVCVLDDFSTLSPPDEIADVVFPVREAFQLTVRGTEGHYNLRPIVPRRKHAPPIVFLKFGLGPGGQEHPGSTKTLRPAAALPSGGPVPLGTFLQRAGQEVPWTLSDRLGAPPLTALLEDEKYQYSRDDAKQVATRTGGQMRGPVPMSFLNAPGSPHNTWLPPQGRDR